MIKSVVRYFTVFIAVLLVIAVLIPSDIIALNARAASTPEFTLETSTESARTGDYITVSLYVDNFANVSVSSFDGVMSFNDMHLQYVDFTLPDSMRRKLTCVDSSASSTSEISFAFADTSKSLIQSGTSHKLLLEMRFKVISTISGSAVVSCKINSWNGSTGVLGISQIFLTVSPTQPTPPTTTTTSSTTQSTASTTALRSSDARLQSLSVVPGALSPVFNPEFVAYTVNVEYEIATIRIAATTNSPAAVLSGTGIKDLAVGQNTFTVTVTAEDGSVKQYGIVVIRAAETPQTVDIIIDANSTVPTIPSDYSIETVPEYIEPNNTAITLPSTYEPDKVIDGGNNVSSDTELVKVIGIIFAEVALFMFGFLAGFFLDKNIKKKNLAEMAYGPLDQQPMPAPPMPPQQTYQQDYVYPEYQEYPQNGYGNEVIYPDASYTDDGFPQYSTYDSPAYDEYGNPIEPNDQYNGGYQGYGDGSDVYYS